MLLDYVPRDKQVAQLKYELMVCEDDIQWVTKLINKVYFQFFSVIINAKKNPNSDLDRENCFQQGFEKMIIVTKFPKLGFPENQNPSFSAPRRCQKIFVLTAQNDRATDSLQNETSPSFLRLSLQKL